MRRLFLKRVQHINSVCKANGVDRPVGVPIVVFDDLQNPRSFALPRLGGRMFAAVLSSAEGKSNSALHIGRKPRHILERGANPVKRLFTRNKFSCHYLSHFWDDSSSRIGILLSQSIFAPLDRIRHFRRGFAGAVDYAEKLIAWSPSPPRARQAGSGGIFWRRRQPPESLTQPSAGKAERRCAADSRRGLRSPAPSAPASFQRA